MYYDPILAKLIAWGEDRETARKRMTQALNDYVVMGIKTTIPYLRDVMGVPDFISGKTTTDFIENNLSDWQENEKNEYLRAALTAAAVFEHTSAEYKSTPSAETTHSPWSILGNWRIGERG